MMHTCDRSMFLSVLEAKVQGHTAIVRCLIKILVSLGWHMVVPRAEVIESPKGLNYFLQDLRY